MTQFNAEQRQIHDLLQACPEARDTLPYTGRFDELKKTFCDANGIELSDSEFWTRMVNVAKKGGISGKERQELSPDLTETHVAILLRLLPVPIGQRDHLPYTEDIERLSSEFNAEAGLNLNVRDVWLAVLRCAKTANA